MEEEPERRIGERGRGEVGGVLAHAEKLVGGELGQAAEVVGAATGGHEQTREQTRVAQEAPDGAAIGVDVQPDQGTRPTELQVAEDGAAGADLVNPRDRMVGTLQVAMIRS